jgi:metal-responsive CopG/Arc/MetJ family transcriptional regulator
MSEPRTQKGAAEPREVVNVRLGRSGLAAIDQLAVEDKRTRSDMIRVLLAEAVDARRKRNR